MGTWGYKPLENDSAQDLLGNFNDSNDVSILENALDAVCELKEGDFLDGMTAEEAIAAADVIKNSTEVNSDDKNRLHGKLDKAINRILEKSELKDLWQDSEEYDNWTHSVRQLL